MSDITIEGKTILITGGAGMIGSHLVRRLIANNCVVVMDDLSSGLAMRLPHSDQLVFYQRSILDDDALRAVFRNRFDYVFHLATQFANQNSVDYPQQDLLVNGFGTLKVLQCSFATEVGRFVYASSSCVCSNLGGSRRTPSIPPALDTPYAITKLLGEQYTSYFHRRYGLPTVTLRYFNSFGPGDYPGKYRGVIPNFFRSALSREPLVITGTGEETRDFNYCDNTVDGTLQAALSSEAVGRVFNLGSGIETTIRALAEKINHLTGSAAGIQLVARRTWDATDRRVADIRESRRMLGYSPAVSLDEGLRRMCAWCVHDADFCASPSDRTLVPAGLTSAQTLHGVGGTDRADGTGESELGYPGIQ